MNELIEHYHNGWRLGVILLRGRKYLTVMEPAELNVLKLQITDERHFRPTTARPKKVARIIERSARLHRKYNKLYSRKQVKTALEILRGD